MLHLSFTLSKALDSCSITKDRLFIVAATHGAEVKSQFVTNSDPLSAWPYQCPWWQPERAVPSLRKSILFSEIEYRGGAHGS